MGWILWPKDDESRRIEILAESSWQFDLVESLSDSVTVCIKDICTGRYLLANTGQAKLCGLESVNDLVGLSFQEYWIEDVHHIKEKFHLSNDVLHYKEEELKKSEQRDIQICSTKTPLTINRIVLTLNNLIRWENLKKLPVLDANKEKVVATLTLTQDITSQIHLSDLLQLYRKYYPDIQAIQLLLKHLKIDSRFTKFPTLREVQILLALHYQLNRKKVSRTLDISHNTLASHLQHLKEKLIVPDLNEVLTQLRTAPINQRPFNPICASESA